MVDLGGTHSLAVAVNARGQVVGVSDGHPVLWEPLPERAP